MRLEKHAEMDFAQLEDIKNHLETLARHLVPTLRRYRHAEGYGFRHQLKENKASLASTATCVSAIQACGAWTKVGLDARAVAAELIKKTSSSKLPEYNPFSIAFVAEGVLDLLPSIADAAAAGKLRARVDEEIGARLETYLTKTEKDTFGPDRGAVAIHPYPSSAYLTQLTYRVVKRCGRANKVDASVRSWAAGEVNKQITLLTAGSRNGDPMQLLYALILAVEATTPGKATPEDKEIFAHALATFFEAQNADGGWPLSRPMFHYANVGNAYCFDYEALTQLLQCQPLRDDLLRHLPSLRMAADLLEATRYDLEDGEGKPCLAWASGHHPQLEGPESWSTASVYHFVHALSGLVAEAIRRALFSQLRSVYPGPPLGPASTTHDLAGFATGFLDADVAQPNGPESLRKLLAERFVFPLAREVDTVAAGGRFTVAMSAILFGPPGTSKTQLATIISGYLRWPLLQVDPSFLVQEGLDRVQAMANKLFSMLVASEQIVVLLDEFDEVGRDRNNNDNLLSRFITTAMLPKLAAINDRRKIVFLLATNYVSGFDAAFRRGGRFDMVLQVMPPNLEAKLANPDWQALPTALAALEKEDGALKREEAEKIVTDLTFLETKELVRALAGQTEGDAIARAITAVGASCTLNKPNEMPSEADDSPAFHPKAGGSNEPVASAPRATWRESCAREAREMRMPPAAG